MLKINLTKRSEKLLKSLPTKHAKQIVRKIMELRIEPVPSDSIKLVNSEYRRADCGEYRIIYNVVLDTLNIILIGKRNDDEIYRQLKRLT